MIIWVYVEVGKWIGLVFGERGVECVLNFILIITY